MPPPTIIWTTGCIMFSTCPSICACARAGCGQRHHLTVLPSTQLVCNFASLHILSTNQFIKQQRTKGHLQVASIYNIYSVQSTDGVYNMYTLHPVSILTFRPQLQRLVLCVSSCRGKDRRPISGSHSYNHRLSRTAGNYRHRRCSCGRISGPKAPQKTRR